MIIIKMDTHPSQGHLFSVRLLEEATVPMDLFSVNPCTIYTVLSINFFSPPVSGWLTVKL